MQKSKSFDDVFWRNCDLKFFPYKTSWDRRAKSLNEVYEGVAGEKNPTKKCCWP